MNGVLSGSCGSRTFLLVAERRRVGRALRGRCLSETVVLSTKSALITVKLFSSNFRSVVIFLFRYFLVIFSLSLDLSC